MDQLRASHSLMPGCHVYKSCGELGPQLCPSMPRIHYISHASSRVTFFFYFFHGPMFRHPTVILIWRCMYSDGHYIIMIVGKSQEGGDTRAQTWSPNLCWI